MDATELNDQWEDFEFNCERSIRYHLYRHNFFRMCSRLTVIATAVFGAGATGALMTKVDANVALWLTAIITAAGTLDLVIDFRGNADLHRRLASRFVDLRCDAVEAMERGAELLTKLHKRFLEIEKEEPPVLKILETISWNDAARARGHKEKDLVPVTFLQRRLRHFCDFGPVPMHHESPSH